MMTSIISIVNWRQLQYNCSRVINGSGRASSKDRGHGTRNLAFWFLSFSGPFRGELGTFFEVGQSARCVGVAQCEGIALSESSEAQFIGPSLTVGLKLEIQTIKGPLGVPLAVYPWYLAGVL